MLITPSVTCLLLVLFAGPAPQLARLPVVNAVSFSAASGTTPYAGYKYIVRLRAPNEPGTLLGGFSEVSGLKASHQVGDVTSKRGVVNSSDLWSWINQARKNETQAKRFAVIILKDESGNPVQSWKLQNAVPKNSTGPKLGGKGGGDVAIEQLELSTEAILVVPRP